MQGFDLRKRSFFLVSERQLRLNGLNPLLVGLESGGTRGSFHPSDLRRSRSSRLSLAVQATGLTADARTQGPYRGRDGAAVSRPPLSTGVLAMSQEVA